MEYKKNGSKKRFMIFSLTKIVFDKESDSIPLCDKNHVKYIIILNIN